VTIKSITEDRYVDVTGQSVDYIKLDDSFESNLYMGTQLTIVE